VNWFNKHITLLHAENYQGTGRVIP